MQNIRETLFGDSVFKDENTLSPGFIPEKLLYRDSQISYIGQNFRSLFQGKLTSSLVGNILILGSAGVGKTSTVRYTMNLLETLAKEERSVNFLYYYINCWNYRTKTAILRGLLREKFDIQMRGLGPEEAISNLMTNLITRNSYLVIVLDEAWTLSQEDIRSFLYLAEEFGLSNRISTIMISRQREWNVQLSSEISQRINDVIKLEPYKKDELREIFEYRYGLALKSNSYNEDTIEMVTEICSETLNVRHGIEIILQAGRIADRSGSREITPEMIRAAKQNVYPELRSELLNELQLHELLVFLGIARRLKHECFSATSIKEALRFYKMSCEGREITPKGEATFRRYLQTLSNYGLISTVTSASGRGKRGIRTKISIHEVPAAVLIERIEARLAQIESNAKTSNDYDDDED